MEVCLEKVKNIIKILFVLTPFITDILWESLKSPSLGNGEILSVLLKLAKMTP